MDPESAFTCALIHNIGELLIQSTLPEEAGLINLAIEKGSSRVEAQREMLGTTMPSSAPSWRSAGTCRPPSSMPSPSSWIPSPTIR